MKGGQRRGGANFLSLSAEFREATYTNGIRTYMRLDWSRSGPSVVVFSHPQDTADNTVWLQELGICHLERVFCSCFLCTRLSFFCSLYPTLKAFTAFLCCVAPVSLPFSFPTLSLPPPSHLSMHCRGPSSVPQLCKQWELFTMLHHQGAPGAPPSSCNLCTSVSHMMLDIIDPLNKSTTQRALKQPFCLKKMAQTGAQISTYCTDM